MIREESGNEAVRRCANCLMPLRGPGVKVNGETYCCLGCANGGPCICTYTEGVEAPPAPATENPKRHISLVISYDSDISFVFKCRTLLSELTEVSGLSPLRFEAGKAILEFEAPSLGEVAMYLLSHLPSSVELNVTTEGEGGIINLSLGNGKKAAAAEQVEAETEEKRPSPPQPSPEAKIAERTTYTGAPIEEVPPSPTHGIGREASGGEGAGVDILPPLQRARVARPAWQLVVDAFFNARHYVRSNGQPGEVHPHSWRVRAVVDVEAIDERGFSIPTRAVRDAIQRQASRFDGALMNDIPPFNRISPTIENVASVLFAAINAGLEGLPVRLRSIWVWDSPTSYVVYLEEALPNG